MPDQSLYAGSAASQARRASPDTTRTDPAPGPAQPARRGSRLAWLDALRGIAALCVVYHHLGARVLPSVYHSVTRVFDPGLYGVLVFFLISGYIVPTSLERKGDVRAFWISRVFRLFPLFAVVIGITLVFHAAGLNTLRGVRINASATAFSEMFMLSDLLAGKNLIVVIWTLSYEMVFYLLLTALFTAGWHRLSGRYSMTFAAGALLLGGILPTAWISYHTFGLTAVAVGADVLTIGGLALAVSTRGWPRMLGAWVAAITGLVLVTMNGRRFAYEGLTILALMFAGTLLYRARQGQVSRRTAAMVVGVVFAAVLAAGAWHIPALAPAGQAAVQQHEWVVTVALAGLTFVAGLTLQRLHVPAGLAWLGLISYSVYLTLPLMLDVYDSIPFPASYQQLSWLQGVAAIVFVAVLLCLATCTYRLVEAPMQRLGRRVAARLEPGKHQLNRQAPEPAAPALPDQPAAAGERRLSCAVASAARHP